jgi:hypothetical protein
LARLENSGFATCPSDEAMNLSTNIPQKRRYIGEKGDLKMGFINSQNLINNIDHIVKKKT